MPDTVMPPRGELATDETLNLISADKVVGTAVYNRMGESLGSVYGLMLNKLNGRVAYAIMSFGGFLGMGESYHPLPWRVLTYDPKMGAYIVDLDRDRLENAPKYTRANEPDWTTYPADIDAYYAIPLV
jgi:PRC-barrel domain protein